MGLNCENFSFDNLWYQTLDGFSFFMTIIFRIIFDCCLLLLSIPLYIYYACQNQDSIRNDYKSIFITGASSGIGKQLAIELAGRDVTLFLQGRDEDRLKKVLQECEKKCTGNGRVRYYTCDVRDTQSIQNCILDADNFCELDLVIANAGVGTLNCPNKPVDFYTILTHILQINLIGTLNTILPIISRFQLREKGHIAIMSSIASYINPPGVLSPYASSKVFLRYLSEVLRWSLSKYNINVTCINPGYVSTPLLDPYGENKKKKSMSVNKASKIIVNGLKRNLPTIDFPGFQWFLGYYFGGLHPFLKEIFNNKVYKLEDIKNRFPSDVHNTINKSVDIYYNIKRNNKRRSSSNNRVSVHQHLGETHGVRVEGGQFITTLNPPNYRKNNDMSYGQPSYAVDDPNHEVKLDIIDDDITTSDHNRVHSDEIEMSIKNKLKLKNDRSYGRVKVEEAKDYIPDHIQISETSHINTSVSALNTNKLSVPPENAPNISQRTNSTSIHQQKNEHSNVQDLSEDHNREITNTYSKLHEIIDNLEVPDTLVDQNRNVLNREISDDPYDNPIDNPKNTNENNSDDDREDNPLLSDQDHHNLID